MQTSDLQFSSTVAPGQVLVEARHGATTIGWADFETERGARWKNCCWLLGIQIHPEHQRRGYGAALLRRVEQVALERGCPCLAFYPVPDSTGFYAKLGYAPDTGNGTGRAYEKTLAKQ